jgi:hypothetical protein
MNQTNTRLLMSMYPDALEATLTACAARPLRDTDPWPKALGFVAVTDAAVTIPHAVDVVMASTCVDHCEAAPGELAATVVADLVHGAVIARQLSVPMLSLVGIGQETRLVPGGRQLAAAWRTVANQVRAIFEDLDLPSGSRLVSTDDEAVWRILSDVVDADRPKLRDQSLDGLYHIGDDSCFPRGTPFSYFYEYYRYNVASYRRPAFESLLGRESDGALVVENIQQIKAVAVARMLADKWPVTHLMTLPAPGRSGVERATRAAGKDRLTCADLLSDPEPALATANTDSQSFWRAVRDHHAALRLEGIRI